MTSPIHQLLLSYSYARNILGWWDTSVASSLHLSGSTVDGIDDISGNGNHMTQNGSHNKPTYSATGFNTSYPAMLFSAASIQTLAASSFPMTTNKAMTVWVVGTMTSSTGISGNMVAYTKPGATTSYNNDGSWLLSKSGVNEKIFMYQNARFTEQSFTYGSNIRVIATVNSGGGVSVSINGGIAFTGPGFVDYVTGGVLSLGNGSASGDNLPLDGKICECGVTGANSTNGDIAALDAALQAKWGL